MKSIAHVNKTLKLFGHVPCKRSRFKTAVIGKNAYRISVKARQGGNLRTSLIPADFEDGFLVKHTFHDSSHVICFSPVARNNGKQVLFFSISVICVDIFAFRHFPCVLRQVIKEALRLRDGVLFTFSLIVNHAADARMYFVSSQLLLRHLMALSKLNKRRSAYKNLTFLLHHHRKSETAR